jgi:hypothetical protein
MAAAAQPTRELESERLRRRRDRHARLATDRALTEVAFMLRARDRNSARRQATASSAHQAGARRTAGRPPGRRALGALTGR